MTICPFCGAENIEGSDECDECQHSLTHIVSLAPSSAVEKGLLKDRIDILRPRPPLVVNPEETVGAVLKKMVAMKTGCAVVWENGRLAGLFTERDAVMRLNVDAARLADRPVRSVMTVKPTTLRARDKIAFALHRMDVGGFRHIPILDDQEQLVGVISVRGILSYLTARNVARG